MLARLVLTGSLTLLSGAAMACDIDPKTGELVCPDPPTFGPGQGTNTMPVPDQIKIILDLVQQIDPAEIKSLINQQGTPGQ